jgi:hypothetical protein
MGFNESHLRVIQGGKLGQDTSAPRRENVTLCFYIDKNGRKAIFCEARAYTVIFTFFSMVMNKYAVLTLSTNRRFRSIKTEDIQTEWEKTAFIEGDIGPDQYGRCFLANYYDEAVGKMFVALEQSLSNRQQPMPASETAMCVQILLPLLKEKTATILELTD